MEYRKDRKDPKVGLESGRGRSGDAWISVSAKASQKDRDAQTTELLQATGILVERPSTIFTWSAVREHLRKELSGLHADAWNEGLEAARQIVISQYADLGRLSLQQVFAGCASVLTSQGAETRWVNQHSGPSTAVQNGGGFVQRRPWSATHSRDMRGAHVAEDVSDAPVCTRFPQYSSLPPAEYEKIGPGDRFQSGEFASLPTHPIFQQLNSRRHVFGKRSPSPADVGLLYLRGPLVGTAYPPRVFLPPASSDRDFLPQRDLGFQIAQAYMQVGATIRELHTVQKIVHRDIKADNFVLNLEEKVRAGSGFSGRPVSAPAPQAVPAMSPPGGRGSPPLCRQSYKQAAAHNMPAADDGGVTGYLDVRPSLIDFDAANTLTNVATAWMQGVLVKFLIGVFGSFGSAVLWGVFDQGSEAMLIDAEIAFSAARTPSSGPELDEDTTAVVLRHTFFVR